MNSTGFKRIAVILVQEFHMSLSLSYKTGEWIS